MAKAGNAVLARVERSILRAEILWGGGRGTGAAVLQRPRWVVPRRARCWWWCYCMRPLPGVSHSQYVLALTISTTLPPPAPTTRGSPGRLSLPPASRQCCACIDCWVEVTRSVRVRRRQHTGRLPAKQSVSGICASTTVRPRSPPPSASPPLPTSPGGCLLHRSRSRDNLSDNLCSSGFLTQCLTFL